MRPHRRQPTRLRRPWDSPGKNTGVGCHFLLQCMKVKSESEVAQSYLTLSDPMDCSLQASSIHGIFQARVLEWGAIAFSTLGSYWATITWRANACYWGSRKGKGSFRVSNSLGRGERTEPQDLEVSIIDPQRGLFLNLVSTAVQLLSHVVSVLLYGKMDQPYIHIYPLLLDFLPSQITTMHHASSLCYAVYSH